MGYSASSLDRKITVQKLVQANDNGDVRQVYRDIANVPANVQTIGASERFIQGADISQRDTQFVIRFSNSVATLNPQDQIKYKAEDGIERAYDIAEVVPIDRRRWLKIIAKVRDAANG